MIAFIEITTIKIVFLIYPNSGKKEAWMDERMNA